MKIVRVGWDRWPQFEKAPRLIRWTPWVRGRRLLRVWRFFMVFEQ